MTTWPFCYYCHQPLCPEHRLLAGEAKQEGKKLGGTSCCCLDMIACKWRASEQIKVLLGMDADAQGTTIRREATVESPQAPVESPYPSETILHEEPRSGSQLQVMSWSDVVPKAERTWEDSCR